MSLDRRQLLIAGLAAAAAPGVTFAGPADALFDALAEALLAQSPEQATSLGLDVGRRSGLRARLSDRSWDAVVAQAEFCARELQALNALPGAGLDARARLDRDVVAYALRLGRDGARFAFGDNTLASAMGESAGPYVVSQQGGTYAQAAEFLDAQHPVLTRADAEAYLARLHAAAVSMDAETARMKRDASLGVIPPDYIAANVLGQMEGLLATAPARSRFVRTLAAKTRAKGIAGDWEGRATAIVSADIHPALSRQRDAMKALAARAGHDGGVWRLPDGEAYYAWLLKAGTNTAMSAGEIHALGLAQTEAIGARMDGLLRTQGLTGGSVGERMAALGANPKFLFADDDAGRAQLIAYLNGLIAGIRPRLASQFTLKLKAPVQVKRVPAEIQDGASLGYMNTGALDGSRPSTYYINLKSMANWPKFVLPSLTYHETVPGHAWQGAYLTETGRQRLVRILLSGFNAYVEGWALYAEQLADEMGMYQDDWAGQLGYLQAQRFRAIRLVVDTGLHARRWSRERAIDWATVNSGRARTAMTSEIDRYTSTPGQACGYKIGHTEINRLRDGARQKLGARFDIRAFNDLMVRTGAVPLTVLAGQVERWAGG